MTDRAAQSPRRRPAGSVLVMAIWVLFFLSALAVAIGAHVSASVRMASGLRNRVVGFYAAKAGIERAMAEAAGDTNAWDDLTESWGQNEEAFRDVSLQGARYSVSCTTATPRGATVARFGLTDEESKININKAGAAVLKVLVETAGNVDSMAAADVAAAILDWRDADDEVLTGGAETGYYSALKDPYLCRNGPFQSVPELLLVKGMTPGLLAKLAPYVAVFGTGRVNVNTASPVVLAAVAEGGGGDRAACRGVAERIAGYRASGGVFSEPSAAAMMKELGGGKEWPPKEKEAFMGMLGSITVKSSCFGGTAFGRREGATTEGIRIVFVFDRARTMLLSWRED